MYRSKLASLIEDAMNECITFGQGSWFKISDCVIMVMRSFDVWFL